MEPHDWISSGALVIAAVGGLAGVVRYLDKQLADKLSIGEFSRRYEDLEKRVRAIERWQDHANGRARFYYPEAKEEGQ